MRPSNLSANTLKTWKNGMGGSTATGVKRVASYHNGMGIQPFEEKFDLPNRESYPAYIVMDR